MGHSQEILQLASADLSTADEAPREAGGKMLQLVGHEGHQGGDDQGQGRQQKGGQLHPRRRGYSHQLATSLSPMEELPSSHAQNSC
jgi:hypothetical protein